MGKKLVVRLPTPHPKQREIEKLIKTYNRIVINAGRRGGKTVGVARIAVKQGGKGRKVLYIAPTSDQTDAFWNTIKEWLDDAIFAGLVHINNTKRIITFNKSGGRIQARTGNKPNHLRGTSGDFIILDEMAYQDPVVWEKVCAPMTLDTNATVIFISTPDLRNHFYHLHLKAKQEEKWAIVEFSSLDNPHLSQEALDDLIIDMTEEDYQQEILAQFLPGEGAVFRFTENVFYTPDDVSHNETHRIVAGLDWGSKHDYTSLSIGCATCNKELALYKTRHRTYPEIREWLKKKLIYPKIELLAEENSIGLPNIEQLWTEGIDVEPFNMTGANKPTVVQAMKLALERETWKWIDDKDGKTEFEAYEMKITPAGNRQYNAPSGLHDDIVVARILMLRQAEHGRITLA